MTSIDWDDLNIFIWRWVININNKIRKNYTHTMLTVTELFSEYRCLKKIIFRWSAIDDILRIMYKGNNKIAEAFTKVWWQYQFLCFFMIYISICNSPVGFTSAGDSSAGGSSAGSPSIVSHISVSSLSTEAVFCSIFRPS